MAVKQTATRGSRMGRPPLVPAIIVLLIVLSALLADVVTRHSPYVPDLYKRLLPPFWQGGSLTYPLGTDSLGRDLLTRIVYGGRVSIVIALAAIGLGGIVGSTLGVISGYWGGRMDSVIMRVADAMMAFPPILLALVLAVVAGPSFANLVVAIGLVLWARFARVIRGEVLNWKNRDFIELARIAGCSPQWIVLRHIVPNVTNTLVVMATLQVGWVILIEATLSFLGVGVPPPTPTWGNMVTDGKDYMMHAWWVSVFPGAAIVLLIMSLNLIGDWLRDTLDPKLRQI